MRLFIISLITSIVILALQIFFSSLLFPFNLIQIPNIVLILLFVVSGFGKTLPLVILLGILKDYITITPFVGITTIFYSISLLLITSIRKTFLTDKTAYSLFIMSALFNTVYFTLVIIIAWHVNTSILTETFYSILINSTLAFIGMLAITHATREYKRKFL